MISELNGSKSAQAFLLFAGSELRKLLQTEDRQAELEFSLSTSQEKVTAASKSGATNLLSLLSESVKKVAARVSSEALYQTKCGKRSWKVIQIKLSLTTYCND